MPPAPTASRGSLAKAVEDLLNHCGRSTICYFRRIVGLRLTDHRLMARFLQDLIDPTCIRKVWHAARADCESWFSCQGRRRPAQSLRPINNLLFSPNRGASADRSPTHGAIPSRFNRPYMYQEGLACRPRRLRVVVLLPRPSKTCSITAADQQFAIFAESWGFG